MNPLSSLLANPFDQQHLWQPYSSLNPAACALKINGTQMQFLCQILGYDSPL